MFYEPPTPPVNLLTEINSLLNESIPERLREVATYAEALAKHKERGARLEESATQGEIGERPDDLPDDVPTKVTIMIREINGDRYYYWQWREDDKAISKYKGPVNPDE